MSAFGGKADMAVCGSPLSRLLLGVKRTCLCALYMSAYDPKRTSSDILPADRVRSTATQTSGDELPLEPLEIAYQIANLIGIQSEFGHIWMASDDPFTECFFKCFDRITVVKFSKWRCQLKRTYCYLIDGVAPCAICSRVAQAPLLPGIHLRIGGCTKNQIANDERNRTLGGRLNFVQKVGAHEFDPCLNGDCFFDPLTVEPAKRSSIVQYDAPCTCEFDVGVTFQISKRARNRFHRQAEVVGDVLSRHWKYDVIAAWNALRHFEQKADHSLFGGLD